MSALDFKTFSQTRIQVFPELIDESRAEESLYSAGIALRQTYNLTEWARASLLLVKSRKVRTAADEKVFLRGKPSALRIEFVTIPAA